jgi:hypothetical protein
MSIRPAAPEPSSCYSSDIVPTRTHRAVGFSGHMTDSPTRESPRFPESRVPEVRARVRAALENQGLLHGVCSGARGGDMLFARAVLELGGRVTLLLPFPPAAFKQTSVGHGWDDEFDQVVRHPSVELRPPLLPQLPATSDEQNEAFERCNAWIVETLETLAQREHDADPMLLVVYHSAGTDQAGGTADAIRRWQALGHRVVVIDPLA